MGEGSLSDPRPGLPAVRSLVGATGPRTTKSDVSDNLGFECESFGRINYTTSNIKNVTKGGTTGHHKLFKGLLLRSIESSGFLFLHLDQGSTQLGPVDHITPVTPSPSPGVVLPL